MPIARQAPDGSVSVGVIARCAHGGTPPSPFLGIVWPGTPPQVAPLPAGIARQYLAALSAARG